MTEIIRLGHDVIKVILENNDCRYYYRALDEEWADYDKILKREEDDESG